MSDQNSNDPSSVAFPMLSECRAARKITEEMAETISKTVDPLVRSKLFCVVGVMHSKVLEIFRCQLRKMLADNAGQNKELEAEIRGLLTMIQEYHEGVLAMLPEDSPVRRMRTLELRLLEEIKGEPRCGRDWAQQVLREIEERFEKVFEHVPHTGKLRDQVKELVATFRTETSPARRREIDQTLLEISDFYSGKSPKGKPGTQEAKTPGESSGEESSKEEKSNSATKEITPDV